MMRIQIVRNNARALLFICFLVAPESFYYFLLFLQVNIRVKFFSSFLQLDIHKNQILAYDIVL